MSELKRHEKEKKEKSFFVSINIRKKNKKDQHKNNMFKYFRNLNSMSLILFRFFVISFRHRFIHSFPIILSLCLYLFTFTNRLLYWSVKVTNLFQFLVHISSAK